MNEKPAESQRSVTYVALLTFFLPIAFATLLVPVANTILNSVIARMSKPEISLAAFAVARSTVFLLQSPTFTIRSSVASLVAGENSHRVVSKFFAGLILIMTGLVLLLGYTNFSQLLLGSIMGIEGEVFEYSIMTVRIFCALPIIVGVSEFYHGIAILLRCQKFIPIATSMRTVFTALVLFLITPYVHMNGALLGGIVFLLSLTIEVLTLLWRLKKEKGSLKNALTIQMKEEEYRDSLSIKEAVRFALPLMTTVAFFYIIRPVVNSALARSSEPATYLAGFEVGYTIIGLIADPVDVLHQCSLLYWNPDDKRSLSVLKTFFLGVTLFLASLLIIIGFTPIGEWILLKVIKAPANILPTALGVIKVGFLFIFARACREYYWGTLMRTRQTYLIAISRIINIVILVPAIILGTKLLPINPGVGACAIWATGEALEGLYIYLLSRDKSGIYIAN